MRITGVESTDLFTGTAQRPLQVIRVTLVNEGPAATSGQIHVQGAGVRDPGPFGINDLQPGGAETFEVPVEIAAPYQPGSTRRVTVTMTGEMARAQAEAGITVAEPGWTMWMVSHFHYDPVWWNTQGQFTEARLALPDEDGKVPDVRSAFELVGAHLDKARKDPDYTFVLAEIDYLKPYFDTYPRDREDLRRLMAEGRVEIVGGNYNEPNTNLICAEAIIRNAVYGIGFQRDVFGGDPRSAWMLDAFGHDPGYPGLMAAAGLTSSAWARGPFHQWGPSGAEGGDRRMQFSTEFEWISPDGQGLLTAYMAHHYGAGWRLNAPADLRNRRTRGVRAVPRPGPGRDHAQRPAAGRLGPRHPGPLGDRHPPELEPALRVAAVHHRGTAGLLRCRPRRGRLGSGAALGHGAAAGAWITPQTRDMNPVYTGKDVSYIDTKQAQRAIETAVAEAERLGTLAWLAGAPYPEVALDKAWRLLAYGAHHDAITGVESDQVYLDLAGGWREAWELATAARRDAVGYLQGGTGAGSPPYAGGPPGGYGGDGIPRRSQQRRPRRRRRQRAGPDAGRAGPGHGGGPCGRHPLAGGPGRRREPGTVAGRGGQAAAGRLAGRGDADVPGGRGAGTRAADLPAGPGGGPRRAGLAGTSPGRRSRTPRTWSRRIPRGAGRSASPTSAPAPRCWPGRATSWSCRTSTRSIPGTARVPGTCRPRDRAPDPRRPRRGCGPSGAPSAHG